MGGPRRKYSNREGCLRILSLTLVLHGACVACVGISLQEPSSPSKTDMSTKALKPLVPKFANSNNAQDMDHITSAPDVQLGNVVGGGSIVNDIAVDRPQQPTTTPRKLLETTNGLGKNYCTTSGNPGPLLHLLLRRSRSSISHMMRRHMARQVLFRSRFHTSGTQLV